MDSSHVSLVSLQLRASGFTEYRADRSISLGLNLASVAKILKCAASDDSIAIRADDDGDVATFMFEGKVRVQSVRRRDGDRPLVTMCRQRRRSRGRCRLTTFVFAAHPPRSSSQEGDRVSEFELKLMDIDSEHLGIPETGALHVCSHGLGWAPGRASSPPSALLERQQQRLILRVAFSCSLRVCRVQVHRQDALGRVPAHCARLGGAGRHL